MHKPESVLKNEMHKILIDFEIDHLILEITKQRELAV